MEDAASVVLGGKWRIPTDEEWKELLNTDNCSWTWTTLDGVNGYMVQSNKSGYTDNWIFLPAAGCRDRENLSDVGEYGYYWSSSLYTGDVGGPEYACDMNFHSSHVGRGGCYRSYGQSIRPVSE